MIYQLLILFKTTPILLSIAGDSVPETGRSVVEGVIFRLDLVVQDNGTLFQSVAQQVLSHDDHSDASTAHVLLSAGEDQPKLHKAGGHLGFYIMVNFSDVKFSSDKLGRN